MLLGLLLLATSLLSTAFANPSKMSVAWELWYPYQYYDNQGRLVGDDITFLKAVLKKANVDYSLDELDWKRHLMMVKAGQIDMAMGASKTDEREIYAHYSVPYRLEEVSLFIRAEEVQKYKLESLTDIATTNMRIGTEQGYFYGEEYHQLIENKRFKSRFHEVVDIEENVRLLLEGKLDGLLADPNTMAAFVEKYQLPGLIVRHPLPIYSTKIYFMFSKLSVTMETVEQINQAIIELQTSGRSKWQRPG